ncbi:hypothetical protein [Tateyamaria sp.]|uniref:hypothetical protein n=1 Tax=Tateyamaria sp. TaxID=1929288 RepID=UPI003B223D61
MAKLPKEIEQLDNIKASVTGLPDEKDDLDIRQYKRQAIMTIDLLRTQMTAVLKLAS